MYEENYWLIVDRESKLKVWEHSKPEDVWEKMNKSQDWGQYGLFILSNVAPHIEWLISLAISLKQDEPTPKRVTIQRNSDGETINLLNYTAEEAERILRAWAKDE